MKVIYDDHPALAPRIEPVLLPDEGPARASIMATAPSATPTPTPAPAPAPAPEGTVPLASRPSHVVPEMQLYDLPGVVRYPLSAALAYGLWYLVGHPLDKPLANWVIGIACAMAIIMCAYELLGGLLLAAIFGGLAYAVFGVLAAIPTSVAVVLGAMIIASSSSKSK